VAGIRADQRAVLRGQVVGPGPLGDVVGPDLRVLFAGINPSLRSAEVGHNFARPGNRFWKALHLAGFTPRVLAPEEEVLLPELGLGITNIASRPTRAASELSLGELREGGARLEALVAGLAPRLVAVVGITAYRQAFARPKAVLGLQEERIGGRPVWVLPNPSGLNASHQLPDLARLYAEARVYAEGLG
jgi:TDG/mug DNA glycosylase family protein